MNLLKTAAAISGLTLLSRITGLLRETLTAAFFGAGSQTDAFFVAFRLPNLLRRLFAEGAFSQAFVPVLGQVRTEQGDGPARELARKAALVLTAVLALICLLAILAAPLLVWLMSGGFGGDAATFDLAVVLTRWMFPYILLISLVALAAGVLNTWSSFKAPAFAPVLLNVSFIGCILLLSPRLDEPVMALAVAVVLGGLAQLALMIMALRRTPALQGRDKATPDDARQGPLGALRQAWNDAGVRRILVLMAPATLAVSVAQISLVINTHIAARLEAGSVSWLSYADRLMELPTALLGVALGTVLLPSLTRAHSEQDAARINELIDWGLRLVGLLVIPTAIGLAVLAIPLAAVLFHYGRFDHQDLMMTAQAMAAYAIGLFGLIAIKVLAPGFYSRQDIRTPVRIALFTLVLTQVLNLALVPMLAHAGLALATSLAACANAYLLLRGLKRQNIYKPSPGWRPFLLKVMLASLLMGIAIALLALEIDWSGMQAAPLMRMAWLAIILAVAALVYFPCLRLLGVRWIHLIKKDVP
jgi:putative peptidoglycan lipid II flippase